MRKFTFQYTTEVEFGTPVESHDFVLRCMPPSTPAQRVKCSLELTPDVPFDMQQDSFGNLLAVGRVEPPHDRFAYQVSGVATIDRAAAKPCQPHPLYGYQSPLTAMSEELLDFLTQVAAEEARDRFRRGGGARSSTEGICKQLMVRVNQVMEYAPGSTTVQTTAAQAFAQRKGVCQDFTHILVALIRESGVPARYVSGLTLGQGATHAWAEAWIDGAWVGLDPTRCCLVDEAYLTLAVGRDWSDCPIERATFQGFTTQTQHVFAQMEEVFD